MPLDESKLNKPFLCPHCGAENTVIVEGRCPMNLLIAGDGLWQFPLDEDGETELDDISKILLEYDSNSIAKCRQCDYTSALVMFDQAAGDDAKQDVINVYRELIKTMEGK